MMWASSAVGRCVESRASRYAFTGATPAVEDYSLFTTNAIAMHFMYVFKHLTGLSSNKYWRAHHTEPPIWQTTGENGKTIENLLLLLQPFLKTTMNTVCKERFRSLSSTPARDGKKIENYTESVCVC